MKPRTEEEEEGGDRCHGVELATQEAWYWSLLVFL